MLRSIWPSFLVFVLISPALRAQEARLTKLPVLLIDVSGRLINTVVEQSIDRVEPVNEVIQETPVQGMGLTRGKVNAELIPDLERGSIDVVFRGQIDSRTVGMRPHTRIQTF